MTAMPVLRRRSATCIPTAVQSACIVRAAAWSPQTAAHQILLSMNLSNLSITTAPQADEDLGFANEEVAGLQSAQSVLFTVPAPPPPLFPQFIAIPLDTLDAPSPESGISASADDMGTEASSG